MRRRSSAGTNKRKWSTRRGLRATPVVSTFWSTGPGLNLRLAGSVGLALLILPVAIAFLAVSAILIGLTALILFPLRWIRLMVHSKDGLNYPWASPIFNIRQTMLAMKE